MSSEKILFFISIHLINESALAVGWSVAVSVVELLAPLKGKSALAVGWSFLRQPTKYQRRIPKRTLSFVEMQLDFTRCTAPIYGIFY